MLAGIYNWFTEGFDTADLKDAKALFEELSVYGSGRVSTGFGCSPFSLLAGLLHARNRPSSV